MQCLGEDALENASWEMPAAVIEVLSHTGGLCRLEVPQFWADVGQGHSLSTGCWAAECAELGAGLWHVLGCLNQVSTSHLPFAKSVKRQSCNKVLLKGGCISLPQNQP